MRKKADKKLRSQAWFGDRKVPGFAARSWLKNQGTPDHLFDGRPAIGICNTWSDLTPCNGHFREISDHVKRGIYEAGGYPLEFPVMSLGETLLRPTSMLFRNLASIDVEESLRSNPVDGVILLVGCDKTTPALLMGAASVDLPTIALSGGPMLNGRFRDMTIGSGTHLYKFREMLNSGEMTEEDLAEAEGCMSRSKGHCMTMGTASTMACMVEALGIGMPMNAAIPAVDARRYRLAHLAGQRIVEMVREDLCMSQIINRQALENAIRVNAAIGGSTNAVVHLLALAGRLGVPLNLEDFDKLSKEIPCLVNLMPSGEYLMEDFYYAGGLPVVIQNLGESIHRDALTVNGKTMGENVAGAKCWNDQVIHSVEKPFKETTGLVVLHGNLAPDGAVLKPTAATAELLKHRGRAVVFEDVDDLDRRVHDESLDIDETCVMVLRNTGPRGYPGMPELGNLPLPAKLTKRGVHDMVRISDARMSGTAFGTVVLHVAPESAVGGPLALVRNGDFIELDVEARKIHLDVDDAELERRRSAWKAPDPPIDRGYTRLYTDHVLQANQGVDLDFLVGGSGSYVPRRSH